ncbi:hypothetical protein ACFYM5_15920 [Streptomyces sp. NPDC006706]
MPESADSGPPGPPPVPRDQILNGPLPTALMKANVANCPFCGTKQF